MNVEIKNHFYEKKKQNIRINIIPGNGKSLLRAVLEAKDLNINQPLWLGPLARYLIQVDSH